MLTDDDVPRDPERLARLYVQLPRLATDSTRSCPVEVGELVEHLAAETTDAEPLQVDDLRFARTAELNDTRYWVWQVDDVGDGQRAYAVVAEDADGEVTIGFVVDTWGLSVEQLVVGDHFGIV